MDFFAKKMRSIFTRFDADKNGVIEAQENLIDSQNFLYLMIKYFIKKLYLFEIG